MDVSHKTVLEEMIKSIRTALSHMIRDAEWMDPETTQNALLKLDRMRHIAAYPDEILNKTLLEELFKGDIIWMWAIITCMWLLRIKYWDYIDTLKILCSLILIGLEVREDDHYGNQINMRKHFQRHSVNKNLKQGDVDPTVWPMDMMVINVVNAFYS